MLINTQYILYDLCILIKLIIDAYELMKLYGKFDIRSTMKYVLI